MDCNEWSDDEIYLTLPEKNNEVAMTNVSSEYDTCDNRPLSQYPPMFSDNDSNDVSYLHQAIASSAILAEKTASDALIHQRRLDNLLSANGLQRIEVAADGDCFFHSSSIVLNISATEIRRSLCDYLDEEYDLFFEFFSFPGDENERYMEYVNNVSELRHSGRWSNSAGDMLPLALASWTNRAVRLYTSNPHRPILDIYPVSGIASIDHNDASTIALGLLQYPGAPHYNACTSKEVNNDIRSIHASSFLSHPVNNGVSETQSPNKQPKTMTYLPSKETCSDHETDSSTPINESISSISFHEESPAAHTSNDEDVFANQQSPEKCSPPALISPETPRKSGMFKTPPKKQLTRKRKATPETWKKNIRKALRLQGKAHSSDKGTHVPAKRVKEVDCSKCKLKCSRLNEKREQIFQTFYALDTYDKQKSFVCTHVTAKKTKTLYNEELNEAQSKKRHVSRQFYFTIEGQKERVCRRFFTSTLGISQNYVEHALQNSEHGVFVGQDGRGRKRPHNKTPDKAVEAVKAHIRSFPTVPSHYTRKDTRREYLSTDLNITKMHELYTEECKKEGLSPVSSRQYRKIFNEGFNLSFHVPKKDQCTSCASYQNKKAEGILTEAEEKAHQQHQDRKESARKEKQADKQAATEDKSKHVVTVDLQAVLQAPCGLVSQLYYKRKLSVYNFTIYSLADGKGTCFIWDETEGMRGSCEIATCLFLYLQSLPSTVREVTIYSDCCGGQNRNQNLTAALIHAVNCIPNIEIIQQKYLETGHTHMECDSMHAAISLAKKCTPIHVPSEWDIILRVARRNKKYTVIPLKHTSFYDFKKLSASFIRNTKTDIEGRKVNWLQIRCMELHKGQEDLMFFKTDFSEDDFRTLRLTGSSKRSRPSPLKTLPLRYTSKVPISAAKHRDLMSLCRSGIIPSHHHPFYQALPVSTSVKDRLAEPDVHDSCTSSDTD